MAQPLDNALAATVAADAVTAQANLIQTSQMHYSGAAAHNAAQAAWNCVGVMQKATYHATQAAVHMSCAASLKAAGR